MHKFGPTDHSAHLAEILARLYRLEDLVAAGDRQAILPLVLDMDWRAVADEFELVVARHCYALEHYAHPISYNLQRPYLLRQDCLALGQYMELLEQAIDESPSLLDDADAEIAAAWRREADKARQRRRPIRPMAPVGTLKELRAAAAEKIRLGRALEGRHPLFDAGERVDYGSLAAGPGASP